MKYLKLASAMGFLFCSSLASAALPPGHAYGGVQAGVDSLYVNQSTKTPIPTLLGTIVENYHFDNGNTGAIAGIYLGYEQSFNTNFFTALEIAGDHDWTTINTTLESPFGFGPHQVKFEQSMAQHYDIALMPGFKIQNSKAYLKLGAHRGKFKFKSTGSTSFDLGFNGNFSEWLTGYSAGAGIGFQLTEKVAMRLEYNYVNYGNVSKTSSDPFTGHTGKSKYSPTSNLVMLGIEMQWPFA